jgi:hypothetical protein
MTASNVKQEPFQDNENMALWNTVCKTDPKYASTIEDGRGLVSANAQYIVQRATEVWGKFGQGWGISTPEIEIHKDIKLVTYKAELWYRHDGKEGNFPIESAWPLEKKNEITGKFITNPECIKAVATSALTKGLSKVGFCADIYLGEFNPNQEKISSVRTIPIPEKAEDKKLEMFTEYVFGPRQLAGEEIFSKCLVEFEASNVDEIKKERRMAFINVVKSYTSLLSKEDIVTAISGPLRQSFKAKTKDPELYSNFMKQFGITVPATIEEKDVEKTICSPLNAMSIEDLREIFRAIHKGLSGITK